MVFSGFGLDLSEDELRMACDCTPLGTDALKAIDAARQLGLAGTAKHTITIEELFALVVAGHYPIVFVSLSPIDGIGGTHALVVVDAQPSAVTVFDPLKGERALPLQAFITAWALRHNLAIIVKK
jgi:ABC-type bacteriocin/lantibiotic exporter with double-glycine peptidase domain